jgi:hypothetical protein
MPLAGFSQAVCAVTVNSLLPSGLPQGRDCLCSKYQVRQKCVALCCGVRCGRFAVPSHPSKGLAKCSQIAAAPPQEVRGRRGGACQEGPGTLSQKLVDFSKVFDELSSMLKQVPYDPELAERADVAHMLHEYPHLCAVGAGLTFSAGATLSTGLSEMSSIL